MAQRNMTFDVENLITAAVKHGIDSNTHHEAGDLQVYIRACWNLLEPEQRQIILSQPGVAEVVGGLKSRDFSELVEDEGIENVLQLIETSGKKDLKAEVSLLQTSLRACWDALSEDQRMQVIELDETQESFVKATNKTYFRYLAGTDWGCNLKEEPRRNEDGDYEDKDDQSTRWVYDRHNDAIVKADAWNEGSSTWVELNDSELSFLKKDLKVCGVTVDSSQFLLHEFTDLPDWQELEEDDSPDYIEEVCCHPVSVEQEWSAEAQVSLLMTFLRNKGLSEEFSGFVTKVAENEQTLFGEVDDAQPQRRTDTPRG